MISGWKVGRISAVALLAIVTLFAGGCSSELQAENDALRVQNRELQAQLDAANEALMLAQDQPAYQPAPAGTGFDNISGIDVSTSAGGEVTVRVPGDVLFSSGKVDLKSSAKSTLNQIASVLTSDYAGRTVRIEGYTDTDPIKKSKWKDNLELSSMRAMAVQRHLASQGVPKDNMYAAGMHTRSQQASKAQSRRVEIVVIMN